MLLRLCLAYAYVVCADPCAVGLLCVDLLLWANECSCFKILIFQLKKAKGGTAYQLMSVMWFLKRPTLFFFFYVRQSYPSSYCTKRGKVSRGVLCSVHLELGERNSESSKRLSILPSC